MPSTIAFERHNIDDVMRSFDKEMIATLPFGAVQLDGSGKILYYNAAEGEITGRNPEAVTGKNFFEEVAPCTNRSEFFGRFQEIVEGTTNIASFEYVFDYEMRPTKVNINMKRGAGDDNFWIFVRRV